MLIFIANHWKWGDQILEGWLYKLNTEIISTLINSFCIKYIAKL